MSQKCMDQENDLSPAKVTWVAKNETSIVPPARMDSVIPRDPVIPSGAIASAQRMLLRSRGTCCLPAPSPTRPRITAPCSSVEERRFSAALVPQDRLGPWPLGTFAGRRLAPAPLLTHHEFNLWKKNPLPRTKPVIAEDTTCCVSLLTGTISGSKFAIP
jgi:hypothetical protein